MNVSHQRTRYAIGVAFVSILACTLTAFGLHAPANGATVSSKILLALGDSLAAGYQPSDHQLSPPVNPVTEFRDAGYRGSYPADIAAARGLQLTDLGCPGETSTSMLSTPARRDCELVYHSEFNATSQINAARAFLNRHRGAVSLVTLDIGTNDVDRCISASGMSASCVFRAEVDLQHNFRAIVTDLRATLRVDDPKALLVTMNYYDPFLGLADVPGGSRGASLATESLIAVNAFNAGLAIDAHALRLPVANVAGTFKIDALVPIATFDKKRYPENVVVTCRLTWMCPTAHTTAPDIHPTLAGYRAIALAFEHILPARLPA